MGKEELKEIVKRCTSFRQVAAQIGVGNQTAKRRIASLGIDTSHFDFGRRYLSVVGKVCGELTIRKVSRDGKRWFARCDCKCGAKGIVKRLDSILNGRVSSCGCAIRNGRPSMTGSRNPAFAGHGELRAVHVANIKKGAERRAIPYAVSTAYLWGLFLEQGARCALSGTILTFGRIYFPRETTASLDRIDSAKGYVTGNVQWVHKDVNKIKRDLGQEYFLNLCHLISDHVRQDHGLKTPPAKS